MLSAIQREIHTGKHAFMEIMGERITFELIKSPSLHTCSLKMCWKGLDPRDGQIRKQIRPWIPWNSESAKTSIKQKMTHLLPSNSCKFYKIKRPLQLINWGTGIVIQSH